VRGRCGRSTTPTAGADGRRARPGHAPGARSSSSTSSRRPTARGFELTRFEHARDPSTTRFLADADLRGLFDVNGPPSGGSRSTASRATSTLTSTSAGCEGEERERARSLVPQGYEAVIGWYVLART